MNDTVIETIPEGFEPLPEGLGFTDNLKPCYRKLEGDSIIFGLRVEPQHGNSMGICHGGVLMTLADNVAASCANMARGIIAGAPTINLSVDFISAARQGQWIEARCERVTIKRRFGFSHGVIEGSKGLVARFNGTFYFPDHPGLSQDGIPNPGALRGLDPSAPES